MGKKVTFDLEGQKRNRRQPISLSSPMSHVGDSAINISLGEAN